MKNKPEDSELRHLEWMLLRWQFIQREEYFLPLARTGKTVDEARRKPKRPELQNWINRQVVSTPDSTTRELWISAPEWITDEIGFDRFQKRVTAARKTAGIGRK